MGCIEVKPAQHRGGVTRRTPDRRLRPTVMAKASKKVNFTYAISA